MLESDQARGGYKGPKRKEQSNAQVGTANAEQGNFTEGSEGNEERQRRREGLNSFFDMRVAFREFGF
jgi:hypothetical protein